MVVTCEHVWREISNYLDGEVDINLRTAMDEHIRVCQRCTAVLTGTRNVIQLYGDERMVEVPLGFSHRLQRRLEQERTPGTRRVFLGWMVAATAALIVAGSFEMAKSSVFRPPELRSEHEQPGKGVPPDLLVVVSTSGKTFHVPGCTFIHDGQLRTITAKEAAREGYAPCVRCLRKYLTASLNPAEAEDVGEHRAAVE
jgi:putative zinc finger protein